MTTQDLFKRLAEANFSFTKVIPEEQQFIEEQKKSMEKLIICGLAEEISKNKYSLSAVGRKAKILGVENWAKSLTDIKRRGLVYDFFELKNNWYNLPKPKALMLKQITSTISNLSIKAVGILISVVLGPIVVSIIWEKHKIELLNIWNNFFK